MTDVRDVFADEVEDAARKMVGRAPANPVNFLNGWFGPFRREHPQFDSEDHRERFMTMTMARAHAIIAADGGCRDTLARGTCHKRQEEHRMKRYFAIALLTAALMSGAAFVTHHGSYERLARLDNVTSMHEETLMMTEAYTQLRAARDYAAVGLLFAISAFIEAIVICKEIKRQRSAR